MGSLLDELKQLVSSFEDNNIDIALCGGLALAAHGFVRATMDIDFMIRPESLERALEVAKNNGYDIRGLDLSFKEGAIEIRRVSKLIDEDLISLDLLLVTPSIVDIWNSREQIDFLGSRLTVVSRDGLVKMKALAGRPIDLVDIERLENEAN